MGQRCARAAPAFVLGPRLLKTPACVRAPAGQSAERGAGGGAALRPGLTCPRSPLPSPAAAFAGDCSCRASELLVSVGARRTDGCTTITGGWTRLPAELGQRQALKLLPRASSYRPLHLRAPTPAPTFARRFRPLEAKSYSPWLSRDTDSPIMFASLSLVLLLAAWPFGKGGGKKKGGVRGRSAHVSFCPRGLFGGGRIGR